MSTKHYKYPEIAKEAVEHWGRAAESVHDAWDGLNNDHKQIALLTAIAKAAEQCSPLITAVHKVLEQLVDDEINQRTRNQEAAAKEEIESAICERETLHGPCPEDLRKALRDNCWDCIQLRWPYYLVRTWRNGELPRHFSACDNLVPIKGTPLRKDYDRWMKRRCVTTARPAPAHRTEGARLANTQASASHTTSRRP